MKPKEAKLSFNKVSEKLRIDLETVLNPEATVEAAETDFGQLLLVDGRPLLFKVKESVLPTLLFTEILIRLPKVTVDMGAIPHVCNGADVMAPGIVGVEGDFKKGDLILVLDQKHGKPLALGEIQCDSSNFSSIKKGMVVKNLHYVSDKYWNAAKTFIK